MSSHEGLPFYLLSHEGFRETCGSRGCITHICVLMFALYKRYVVVAVVLNISAHSICFIQRLVVVTAILPISAFLLCFIHKVRGSCGCVNHSCVLVFALYKRYVVVAVVLNISAHSICFIQKVSGSRGYITHIRVSTLLYTQGTW